MESRILVKILRELATELSFRMVTFSDDWIIRLEKGSIVRHIIAYDWGLNVSTAQLLAKDKNACTELLGFNNIPHIEHRLFQNPRNVEYLPEVGNWRSMIEFFEKHNHTIVVKPNGGASGQQVYLIKTPVKLEEAVHNLFANNRTIAFCPFYEYENEYRVVVQHGKIELIYNKIRPFVIGDGISQLSHLIIEKYGKVDLNDFGLLVESDLSNIIPATEKVLLAWKHNLAKGATAVILKDEAMKEKLSLLAQAAAKAINIDFASVDIAECTDGLRVVEINSGVMMEKFAQQSDEHYAISKGIYRNSLKLLGF